MVVGELWIALYIVFFFACFDWNPLWSNNSNLISFLFYCQYPVQKDKDTVTYNILINACSIEGEWQLAQHFLQQLHGKFQKCLTPTKDVGWC